MYDVAFREINKSVLEQFHTEEYCNGQRQNISDETIHSKTNPKSQIHPTINNTESLWHPSVSKDISTMCSPLDV